MATDLAYVVSGMNATGAITISGHKLARLKPLFAAPKTGTCKSTNSSIPKTQTTETGEKSNALLGSMLVKSLESLDSNLD